MQNQINNKYIEAIINDIKISFGIKEPIMCHDILSVVSSGNILDVVKLLLQQYNLPIKVNIINVSNDYQAQNTNHQFHSTQLVNVNSTEDKNESITAQVIIPNNLPPFNSHALKNFPIDIMVSNNCIKYPIVFSMIIAHELAHVLLYSLKHPQRENEFFTDLTAFMYGFQDIFQNGRKITNTEVEYTQDSKIIKKHTTTYGYLDDKQFNFALNKIVSILNENRDRKNILFDELNNCKKLLLKYGTILTKFKYYLEYLIVTNDKKINMKDSKKIITFFTPGYIEEFESFYESVIEQKDSAEKFLNRFSHYTEQNLTQLSNYIIKLKSSSKKIKIKLGPLKKNVSLLSKHVGVKYKLKAFSILQKNVRRT